MRNCILLAGLALSSSLAYAQSSVLAQEGDQPVDNAESTINQPTRTEIVGETPIVTSWLSTSTDWSLSLESYFPTLNPAELSQLSDVWSCNQQNAQFTATYRETAGQGNITGTSTITEPETLRSTTTTEFFNRYTYTKCDGIPRIGYSGGTPSYTVLTTSTTLYDAMTITETLRATLNMTQPQWTFPCTTASNAIANDFCKYMVTIFWDYYYSSSAASLTGTVYTNTPFRVGFCHFGVPYRPAACNVRIGDATMMYCK